MSLGTRAEMAAAAVVELLGAELSPEQNTEVKKIIETAMIDAYRDCTERNAQAALQVCDPDLDKAHKIADEMRRANTALIANLSSMR